LTPIGSQLVNCQAPAPHGASVIGWPLSEASTIIGRCISWTLEGRLNANATHKDCWDDWFSASFKKQNPDFLILQANCRFLFHCVDEMG